MSNTPWRNEKGGIKCCYKCVAPKRHVGCHDTCEEYKAEKEELKVKKEFNRKNMPPVLSNFDFDFNASYSITSRCKIKRKSK